MPETRATLRYLRTSPPKVRQVLGLIRGLDVEEARQTLEFCERAAAGEVLKLLDSAVANAEHNQSLPVDELFVARAYADEGTTLKRWRPRARGRGTRIRKRTSHVTIVVSRFADDELERRRRRDTPTGPARRRPIRRRAAPPAEEHDDEHEHGEPAVETEPGETVKKAPAKKAPSKKKAPARKAPAKKAPAKKTSPRKKASDDE
jgi:large subunit ribosomal protein L22